MSLISTKRRALGFLLLFLSFFAPETRGDAVRQALDKMFLMDYPAAEAAILEGLSSSSPAQPYFAGTICLNRFLDWGDTAALTRAERYWEKLSPRGSVSPAFKAADPAEVRLYRGLAGFQQSYAASLRGQRLRPATLALAARQQLAPLERPEARASLMIYDYYRDRLVGKLPFIDADAFPVSDFTREAEASAGLRDMFLFSLFWIHVENGRLSPALRITEGFLERYPDHRLARELRGSALYRAGRHAEARAVFEKLREDYSGLKRTPERLPLGYYRAVGNLARVYQALGLRAEAEARRGEWNRASRSGAGPWLPASLKKDLAGS
jgi:hypothetical protein